MKTVSAVILAVLALGFFAPHTAIVTAQNSAQAVIAALDVCHQYTPPVYSTGNMPCMIEKPCSFNPAFPAVVMSHEHPMGIGFLLSIKYDRPPKA